ncbi:MAG: gliding motility protein GldN [Prevotellaceae bacterium]|jgi:gliding motility associated protien GldN|nr:gliding motility protein GldN [Prevotellaceae bacterium]
MLNIKYFRDMKNVKFSLPIVMLFLFGSVQAQQKLSSDSTQLLFDNNGALTQIRVEPEHVQNKVISINPRIDDVIWRRKVLRVVDLREQQNRSLYYPVEDLAPGAPKNLFAIIFSNLLEGKLTAYKSQTNFEQTYVPDFTAENLFNVEDFLDVTGLRYQDDNTWARVNYMAPGVIKYYLQVLYYFNKATSTFHSQIMAIAPLYDENYNHMAGEDIHTSVYFWVPFESLRPFLQEDFIKMNGRNTMANVDFDEFLNSNYYHSYIMKDYDITSKDVDATIKDPRFIRQEQNRIEAEILDFEQDLWAY